MKTKLFFILLLATANLIAQTETINIDWSFGSNPSVAESAPNYPSKTIEVGDTVNWNFNGTGTHTVTSEPGSSETWDSGLMASGPAVVYSRTFTTIGTNPYVCTPHNGNMNGTITVVADGTLGVEDFSLRDFKILPNPATTEFSIDFPQNITTVNIEVYNILSKRVYTGKISEFDKTVNVSSWNSGVYLVKLSNEELSQTKRFIKQ